MHLDFEVIPDGLRCFQYAFSLCRCDWNPQIHCDGWKQKDRPLQTLPLHLQQLQEQVLHVPVSAFLIGCQMDICIHLRQNSVEDHPEKIAILETVL